MSELFSLQGAIYSAVRDKITGRPGKRTWLGNASTATLALTVDKSDKNESFSGSRGLYGSLIKAKGGTFSATLDELLPENIGLGLYATPTTITAGNEPDETLPAGLVAGDEVQVDQRFISNLVLTDSAGVPVTLDEDVHYEVVSPAGGIIKFLDVATLTQPFHAAYDYAAADSLVLFENTTPPERWIFFDGVNTVTNEKVILDLYRVQFDPVSNLNLIDEDWGGLELSGPLLVDAINLKRSNMGGYGRLMKSKAA